MTGVIFQTPGLLDLSAINTFGMNSKPNTKSPIGYFGTGLKYAIAVLVREGITVRIFIGPREYVFYKKEVDFRGKEFSHVMMRQRNGIIKKWTSSKLPFTTELGKNWKLWQAFRELESNTRDENGLTEECDESYVLYVKGQEDRTIILVEGEAFHEEWQKRDEIFLPGGLTQREGNDKVQVFDQPSMYIYYRGMRVFDLKRPTRQTYNILDGIEITEDRTIKYDYQVSQAICSYVACSTKDEKLINTVVTTDKDQYYEGEFSWDYIYSAPSKLFADIIEKKLRRDRVVLPRVSTYYSSYQPERLIPDEEMLWFQLSGLRDDESFQRSPEEDEIIQQCIEALKRSKDRFIAPTKVEAPAPKYDGFTYDEEIPF